MTPSFLNLLTTEDISAPDTGRKIGEVVLRHAPQIFPEKIGNWEPIDRACKSPDDFYRHWQWPVLGKRRTPRVSFSVWFRGQRRRYSLLKFGFDSREISTVKLTDLMAELGVLTRAEFGMIQEVTPAYRSRAEARGLLQFQDKLKRRFSISLFDEAMTVGIPDAFDFMWLSATTWTVGTRNLLTVRPGLFQLEKKDSTSRDEALGEIRRKG